MATSNIDPRNIDAPRSATMPMDDAEDITEIVDGVAVRIRGNGATVDFNPGMGRTSASDSDDHVENLVDTLDEKEQTELISDIIEMVAADLNSRKEWQSRVDQAMELLGLRNQPEDDMVFEGASSVTYPLIGEACVQFQARAIEEVFPSNGPCKTKIVGDRTQDKEEQAARVEAHMNFQMMDQDRAYFWHTDQMLFWLPVAGSAFKKTYYDPITDMVVSRLVFPGDFIVPYVATDLRTAPRYTHRLWRTDGELKRLMASGFYDNVELSTSGSTDMDSDDGDRGREMADEADDRNASMHEKDHVYEIYECHIDLELDVDQNGKYLTAEEKKIGRPLPYIVTINKTDETLLSVRRNWRETDNLYEKRLWFTHYKYLSGLGFYGFGLLHLIGSVAEASTGTMRALLDSAAFANLQGGFMSDEAKIAPGDEHISPGRWKQVKMSAEELQRAFYTPPFKEPSPALASLFQTLVESGRRFASITEEMVGDAPNTGPVGTTVALIEQGSKVFSGVHRRLHTAQAEEFALRAELNFEFLDEEYPYQVEGQDMMVMKADYDGRVDVVPVSDPNIFSSTQRIAQAQAMVELAQQFPNKIDLDEVIERFLIAIKVPDHEALLLGKNASMRRDPIQENMMFLTGGGAKAYVEQDHDSHIAVHMTFMEGLNDDAMPIVMPPMQAHLAEHYALKYWREMSQNIMEQTGEQIPPPTFMDKNAEKEDEEEMPIEADQMISQIAAQMPPIQLMPQEEDGPDAEQAEFEAEQQRKQMAFEAEEQRKQQAFDAEQERKDMAVDMDAERKIALGLTDDERKEEQHQQALRHKEREARLAKDKQRSKA